MGADYLCGMTNEEIQRIALAQSAVDCNCLPEDFLSDRHRVTLSRRDPAARRYLPLPFACDMVSYGNNVVAQTDERVRETVERYLEKYSAAHCFETPNIHVLDDMLKPHGLKVCFQAEYFLPDAEEMRLFSCAYELRVLTPADFADLYLPEWSNALCAERKTLDVLAVGAYDGDRLVGLAGCSADCEAMYQIGVDVLPDYRRRGIAAAVTSHLAREIFRLGKVPFYCTAWCNLRSARNAVKCGFRPAWTELTAREISFVEEFNQKLKLR